MKPREKAGMAQVMQDVAWPGGAQPKQQTQVHVHVCGRNPSLRWPQQQSIAFTALRREFRVVVVKSSLFRQFDFLFHFSLLHQANPPAPANQQEHKLSFWDIR